MDCIINGYLGRRAPSRGFCNQALEKWLLKSCGGFGKREIEGGAVAELAFGPDPPALACDQMFHNGKTKAGAALFARAGFIHAIESLENAFQCIGRDAR